MPPNQTSLPGPSSLGQAQRNHAAIIFDMDGVIVDSEPRHERAFREVFHQMGYGENHGMDFPYYYGRSDRALWLDFIRKHQPPWSLEELTEWKQRRFLEIIRQEQPIFAGLPELLEELAPRYQLAVASGSFHPVIDEVLGMKNLRRFFPVVVSVQDVPRGKPAPDVFLRAAELLQVPPGNCCVIEDAAAGVEAALAAGMAVIGITNSLSAGQLARATHVVRNYEQISRLLRSDAARSG
jgi:HAD superfamily hydrolase (TIGR01509 family)